MTGFMHYFEDPDIKSIRRYRVPGVVFYSKWRYEKTLQNSTVVEITKEEYKKLEKENHPRVTVPYGPSPIKLGFGGVKPFVKEEHYSKLNPNRPAFFATRGSLGWVGLGNGLAQVGYSKFDEYEIPLYLQPQKLTDTYSIQEISRACHKAGIEREQWLKIKAYLPVKT